jgi:hypothetical protein
LYSSCSISSRSLRIEYCNCNSSARSSFSGAIEGRPYVSALVLAGERIVVNPEPLFRYRRRADSLSADRVKLARWALAVFEKLDPQFAGDAGLARLALERRDGLRAEIELELGEGLCLKSDDRKLRIIGGHINGYVPPRRSPQH